MTIATNPEIFPKDFVDSATACIYYLADNYIELLAENGYGVAMTENDFNWGSADRG